MPFSNIFPTLKKIDFKINLVLDVPEGAKLPRLTESFREICTLVTVNVFFDTPCVESIFASG